MNKEFIDSKSGDWLCWLGQPMLYDGGLCVNRTSEEHEESSKHNQTFELK